MIEEEALHHSILYARLLWSTRSAESFRNLQLTEETRHITPACPLSWKRNILLQAECTVQLIARMFLLSGFSSRCWLIHIPPQARISQPTLTEKKGEWPLKWGSSRDCDMRGAVKVKMQESPSRELIFFQDYLSLLYWRGKYLLFSNNICTRIP